MFPKNLFKKGAKATAPKPAGKKQPKEPDADDVSARPSFKALK